MRRFINIFAVAGMAVLFILGVSGQADAQRRSERDVRDALRSLNSKIDDFQFGLNYQLRSSSANRQDIDDVATSLRGLQEKIDAFEKNLDLKRENRDDVSQIIAAAKDVDRFLVQKPQNRRVENDWSGVRDQINRLASNYGVIPDWTRSTAAYPDQTPSYRPSSAPAAPTGGFNGTYDIDRARSESVADIISSRNIGAGQKRDLESKLEAPDKIAISVRGNQVTLASSNAEPVTFIADGRDKTEQSGGKAITLRATLRGDQLTIASIGGQTDYTVTFAAADNGQTLKVTRRITTDYLRETIFAESVYRKTDEVAGLGIDANATVADDSAYSSNVPDDAGINNGPVVTLGRTGEFIVPDGSVITGLLENNIDTKVSQNNDRFRMTVQSPDEFRGAVIEGYITGVGRSGQISGRSNITFNFERITLRDGKSYDFAGYLASIKDQNGKDVKVDTEGTAKGDSQTKETAKRGGIGAGLGAIIGAIAGGGKGAAIGAIIGGGAGAGSVIVQGRDDIQLMKGSAITVRASSPIRSNQPVSEN